MLPKTILFLLLSILFFSCENEQKDNSILLKCLDAVEQLTEKEDSLSNEIKKIGIVVFKQDSLLAQKESEIFKLTSNTKKLNNQIIQLQRLITVNEIGTKNAVKEINRQKQLVSIANDSIIKLNEQNTKIEGDLVKCVSLLDYITINGYILEKEIVDNRSKEIDFKIVESQKLYQQCLDGNLENISECTCNDLSGQLKYYLGERYILDKIIGRVVDEADGY